MGDATDGAGRPGWEALRARFRWSIPQRFNIAEAAVGRWARQAPEREALIHRDAGGGVSVWRYRDLERGACRLANVLAGHGIGRGDRIGVLLPQAPEALLTHLAAYRLGAIVVPLFTLFGADALAFRLADSGAAALVTDNANLPKIVQIRDTLPALRLVLSRDGDGPGAASLPRLMEAARDSHGAVATAAEDPAFIAYTSGTTGPPKGALHAHRVLLGHLPGIGLVHDFAPRPGDRFWTPADWAWMGGLCNTLLPALHWGVPVLAHRMEKFDPARAFGLIAEHGIRNVFLPPTALKLMRQVPAAARPAPTLRTVGSAGESLGAALLDWGREALGRTIHEFYGQTECNAVLANSTAVMPVRPGAMGRAVPGYDVAILDSAGRPLPPGETGEIAVRRGGAAMFLGYWNNPDKTAAKFAGEWMLTGDEGVADTEGYVTFAARTDDVITSSGYRIGPTEIEHCLAGHADVLMAGVVGLPDPVRTEAVTAFVVPRPDATRDESLADALIAHVRRRVGAHLVPRRIVFVDALPMTATGKIMRAELRRIHASDEPAR